MRLFRPRRLPRKTVPSNKSSAEAKKRTRRETVTYVCAVVSTIAVVAGLALTLLSGAGSSAPARLHTHEGTVELTQAYVKNAREDSYADASGSEKRTLASEPTVEMTLLNAGAHRVLVTGAQVKIEAYGGMSLCYSQGGGPVPEPNPYTIKLATLPLPSERLVEAPLHEQIPAGEADRIALRFAADGLGFEGYSLYRLAIALKIHGSAKPLDIGRFVLSAPAGSPDTATSFQRTIHS